MILKQTHLGRSNFISELPYIDSMGRARVFKSFTCSLHTDSCLTPSFTCSFHTHTHLSDTAIHAFTSHRFLSDTAIHVFTSHRFLSDTIIHVFTSTTYLSYTIIHVFTSHRYLADTHVRQTFVYYPSKHAVHVHIYLLDNWGFKGLCKL